MNSTPNRAMFCTETMNRSLPKRRAYWSRPTQSSFGSRRELENDSRTVHSMQPR